MRLKHLSVSKVKNLYFRTTNVFLTIICVLMQEHIRFLCFVGHRKKLIGGHCFRKFRVDAFDQRNRAWYRKYSAFYKNQYIGFLKHENLSKLHQKISKRCQKCAKADFDQHLEYAAPKCWSKHTTTLLPSRLQFKWLHIFICEK